MAIQETEAHWDNDDELVDSIFATFEQEWGQLSLKDRRKSYSTILEATEGAIKIIAFLEENNPYMADDKQNPAAAIAEERVVPKEPVNPALREALLRGDTSLLIEQGPKQKLLQTTVLETVIKELLHLVNTRGWTKKIELIYEERSDGSGKKDALLKITNTDPPTTINVSELLSWNPNWSQCEYSDVDRENYDKFVFVPNVDEKSKFGRTLRHLTSAEKVTLSSYTGSFYIMMNHALRTPDQEKSSANRENETTVMTAIDMVKSLLFAAFSGPALQRSIDDAQQKFYVASSLPVLQERLMSKPEDFANFSIVLVRLPSLEGEDKRAIIAIHEGEVIANGLEDPSLVIDIEALCSDPTNDTFLKALKQKLPVILDDKNDFQQCEFANEGEKLNFSAALKSKVGELFNTSEVLVRGDVRNPILEKKLREIEEGIKEKGYQIENAKGLYSVTRDKSWIRGADIVTSITRPLRGQGLASIKDLSTNLGKEEGLFAHDQELLYYDVERKGNTVTLHAVPIQTNRQEEKKMPPSVARQVCGFFAKESQVEANPSSEADDVTEPSPPA